MQREHHPDCWLAHNGRMEHGDPMPPCSGSLVRVHLIPRQVLRREHLPQLDPRTYVYACGGITGGPGGHHGMFDQGNRRLRVRRDDLPIKVEEFAEEHGITWWLDREYGERHANQDRAIGEAMKSWGVIRP